MINIESAGISELLFITAKHVRREIEKVCKGIAQVKIIPEQDALLINLFIDDSNEPAFSKKFKDVSITISSDVNSRVIAGIFIAEYRKKVHRKFFW